MMGEVPSRGVGQVRQNYWWDAASNAPESLLLRVELTTVGGAGCGAGVEGYPRGYLSWWGRYPPWGTCRTKGGIP